MVQCEFCCVVVYCDEVFYVCIGCVVVCVVDDEYVQFVLCEFVCVCCVDDVGVDYDDVGFCFVYDLMFQLNGLFFLISSVVFVFRCVLL